MKTTFMLVFGALTLASMSLSVKAEPGEEKCILESGRWDMIRDDIQYCDRVCGEGQWTKIKVPHRQCITDRACKCK